MKAIVAGATGLIGTFLLKEMQADDSVSEVTALTRREKNSDGKTHWAVVDFDDGQSLENAATGSDKAFCCLGTTMKTAGSKEAFRKVDHHYVIAFAKAVKAQGIKNFNLISAIASDPDSSVFYNQVKGEMERDLEKIGFERLTIFHPSLLLGPREEHRLGEKIGTVAMKIVSPLMLGALSKYKPIHVREVASAMLAAAKEDEAGVHHFEYAQMT